MATISLNASLRDGRGKGAARKLRATGQVPAVVYGAGSDAVAVSVDPRTLELGFGATQDHNTLVALGFADGSIRTCLVKEVQRHPVGQNIEHVDFYEVDPEVELTLPVIFTTTGRAAGVRAGGTMNVLVRHVDVRCKPAFIPSSVSVDVTPLGVGQSLRVSDIAQPTGCTIVYRNNYAVVEVVGKVSDAAPAAEAPKKK